VLNHRNKLVIAKTDFVLFAGSRVDPGRESNAFVWLLHVRNWFLSSDLLGNQFVKTLEVNKVVILAFRESKVDGGDSLRSDIPSKEWQSGC